MRPTFLPSGMVTERSSPSRVRSRRTERALDGSGPLCKTPPLGRKVDFRKGKIKIYLTSTGILMEGVLTSLRRLFAHTSERGYPALGAHASTFFD